MKTKQFKSIRIKTLKVLALLFLGLIVTVYFLLGTVMSNTIRQLEEKDVKVQIELVQNTIVYNLKALSQMALDWGLWDDSYQFMQDRNSAYIAANMTNTSFANIGVDFVIYVDNTGREFYHGERDSVNRLIKPLNDDFIENFNGSPVLKNTDPQYRLQGLILLDKGPALIASSPILPSNGEGPVLGNIIMGTYLHAEAVQALSARLQTNIQIQRLDEFDSAQRELFAALSSADPIAVRLLNGERIAGYSVLTDINHNAALGLRVEKDRTIALLGQKGIQCTLLVLLAISCIFIICIIVFIERHLISRLLALSKDISGIGKKREFSNRLPKPPQEDELSIVALNINKMLDELEKSEQQIVEMNRELERKVEERTLNLAATNQSLEAEILTREKIEEQIKYIAYHDNLTNLPNRRFLKEQIHHAIALTKRTGKMLAVMFMDLDNFKLINDTMGHSAGDKMLIAVSDQLVASLRESDFIARIGGDEFVILIENLESLDVVHLVAKKIMEIFKEPIVINRQECFVSASIGVALYPEDGIDAEALIKNADIAMYKAKSNGKNQCVFCTPLMKTTILETMKLTNSLYYALERGEFELYYQPQINCQNFKISGMEALLRWNHPELGIILPNVFIPIAEQNGLIPAIGDWVLRTVCRQNKAWQDAGHPKIFISVNLSPRQFLNAKLPKEVAAILAETGLEAKYLELELSENITMKGSKYVQEVLLEFRAMGLHISIDHFGTEHASLSYLKNLPVDKIKIDMTFVHGVDIYKKDEAIIKAIIMLAKNMGFSVLAEGVETERQLAFLIEENCDAIQGNYCYKPMTAAEIEKILK